MGIDRVNRTLNIEYSNLIKRNNEYSIFNINSKRDKSSYSEKEAQQRAMYLADKFGNQSGIKFYLKCAWNLSDPYIDWLVEYSLRKAEPTKYFIAVANKKMLENS